MVWRARRMGHLRRVRSQQSGKKARGLILYNTSDSACQLEGQPGADSDLVILETREREGARIFAVHIVGTEGPIARDVEVDAGVDVIEIVVSRGGDAVGGAEII